MLTLLKLGAALAVGERSGQVSVETNGTAVTHLPSEMPQPGYGLVTSIMLSSAIRSTNLL